MLKSISLREATICEGNIICVIGLQAQAASQKTTQHTQSCFWIYNFTFFSVCFRIPCEIVVDILNVKSREIYYNEILSFLSRRKRQVLICCFCGLSK